MLDRWLEHLESVGRSPSTLVGYRSKVESAIRPALGHRRLDLLGPADLDNFYRGRVTVGNSAKTVLGMHRVMSSALAQAVRWGWISSNPAVRSTPPSVPMREVPTPTPDEFGQLVECALTSRQPERAPLLMFLALTGMRRGEVCGLKWGDVDFGAEQVTVRRTVLDVGKLVERQPKTGRVRRIALGVLGIEILRERRDAVDARAAEVGAAISADAFVWSDSEDGLEPLHPGTITQYFSRLVVQSGLVEMKGKRKTPKFSLHSLRHFSATQLVGSNIDVRTVSARTGHADATTVLRVYAHAIEERDLEAANVLGGIIDRATGVVRASA